MRPILFSIGDIPIPAFPVMIMLVTLVATFYGYWVAGRVGLPRERAPEVGIIVLIAGVAGGRLFHVFVEAPAYYWKHPLQVFYVWQGGIVSYGAFIVVALALYAYAKWIRVDFWEGVDVVALCGPIIQFFVRIGCFLAGCCYGKPTTMPWGVRFTNPMAAAYYDYPNILLHPTQLYDAAYAVGLFVFFNWFYFKKRKFPGQTVTIYLGSYLVLRSIVEIWRADEDRGMWFGGYFSTGQVLGIAGVILTIFVYQYLKRHYATSSR